MTDTTTAAAAPTESTPVEWHTVDADDRWPGIYLIRITPGDHATYLAPGFYADVDGGYGQRWGMRATTLDEAKRRTVEDVLR